MKNTLREIHKVLLADESLTHDAANQLYATIEMAYNLLAGEQKQKPIGFMEHYKDKE